MAEQTISLSLPEQVCTKLWMRATEEGMERVVDAKLANVRKIADVLGNAVKM